MSSSGLIDKTIPGLYNGVSQQSKEFVRDTQCLAQENAYSTIIGGLRKRPPLQFVQKDLDVSNELNGAFYHTYDRGRIGASTTSEAYITAVTDNGKLRVWDASGSEYTVKMYTDSAKTNLVTTHPYLTKTAQQVTDGIGASEIFRATTVADGTFFANTSKVVSYTADVSLGTSKNYWTYWIKKTFYVSTGKGYDYTITDVNTGTTVTANSDSSSVACAELAHNLGGASSGWVSRNPFVVYVGDHTTVHSGTDSAGGSATSVGLSEVTSITQLPAGSMPNLANKTETSDTTTAAYITNTALLEADIVHQTSTGKYYLCILDAPLGTLLTNTTYFTEIDEFNPTVKVQGLDKGDDSYYYVSRDKEAWRECIGFDEIGAGLNYKLDETTTPHILKKEGAEFHFYPSSPTERIVGDDEITPAPSFIGNTINDIFMFNDRLGLVSGDSIVLSETSNYVNYWATTARSFPDTDPIDLKIDSTQVLYIDYAVSYSKELMLFTKEGQYILEGQNGLVTPTTVSINRVTSYPFSSTARPLSIDNKVLFSSTVGNFTSIYEYNVQNLGATYEGSVITDHIPSYIPKDVHKIVGISSVGTLFVLPQEHANELYVYNYYTDGRGQKAQSAWSKWTFNGNIIDIFTLDNYLYISKFKNGVDNTKILNRIDMSLIGDPLTVDYRDEIDSAEFLDYQFYYKFKKWYLDATESGIDNRRGRLVIRSLLLNYNNSSAFTVDITRGGSTKTLSTAELVDGKILIGSKSDGVDIEIFNNSSAGLQLNTVSFEGTYYSRSRNIKGR